jgi:hypothetical protein
MSVNDTIQDFKHGRLQIDCGEMTLVQMNEENPISYRGKGYIRHTSDDNLMFKIFVDQIKNNDKFRDLKRTITVNSGQILPENSYFRLSGTAFDRTVWSADRFTIDPHWPVDGEPIVDGKLWGYVNLMVDARARSLFTARISGDG